MDEKRIDAVHARDILPFAGLGFDLGKVRARAVRMSFSGRAAAPEALRAKFPVTWLAAGYDLHVRLGREVRGC